MNKRHYEHTLPNIRGSLSNTYIVTVAVKFYPAVEKEEEAPAEPVKKQEKGKK